MEHLSADQQNHIHHIMRCIQKVYVKKCLVVALNMHHADLSALVAVMTPMLREEGCTFSSALVRELIIEIKNEFVEEITAWDEFRLESGLAQCLKRLRQSGELEA